MKVLFLTNYPSPYRVDFFNMLGQHVDLTVAFTEKPEEQSHRSEKWFNKDYSGFHAVFLIEKLHISKLTVCKDVIPLLHNQFDFIILGGYSSGTQMFAIEYMRAKKIPFVIEADGGIIEKESKIKCWIKRHLIGSAVAWLSSGKQATSYFLHYGAKSERIFLYPFSSLKEIDIKSAKMTEESNNSKQFARMTLRIQEPRMILFVGQVIYGKGIDLLLQAAKNLPDDIAVMIVGGKPSEEYLSLKHELNLNHVYFEDFKEKQDLAQYYMAADLFVMTTRKDVWGLVINEAMSYGLPIVSTDRCVAAMELVENNVNGLIVPADDIDALAKGIMHVLSADLREMGRQSVQKISGYTIEKMVEAHVDFFEKMKR